MSKCGDCGVDEGEIHQYGCDMEVCPFCGGQLLSCECPDNYTRKRTFPDYSRRWLKALNEIGRIPYIEYPVICAKCGALYPHFFSVSDTEWEHYIQPNMRDQVICRGCYNTVKALIDGAQQF